MTKVIQLKKYIALQELEEILPLETPLLITFLQSLEEGATLAQALRSIDIINASEVSLEIWPHLRAWRNKYYPVVAYPEPEQLD